VQSIISRTSHFYEVTAMKLRSGMIAGTLLAAAMLVLAGCDNTANEEGLDKSRAADGASKTYKSYGEFAQQKADELKAKQAEAAASKGDAKKKP
jgi:predicted small secreted protein